MKHEVKNPAERLIVALDYASSREALALVDVLGGHVSSFKIGLQLYTSGGPEIVRAVAKTGAKIFLDLKLHDIPNTVAKAVTAASELNVAMLTVHLSGGRKMLEAAVAAAPPELLLLGVTVLTSSDETTLRESGVNDSVDTQTLRLARLGAEGGIRGLIASPHELRRLRAELGRDITIITPGVRPAGAAADDQKRFTTPAEAISWGADYLVIGRPITAHAEPLKAARAIIAELA